jgi:hypothetical protein
MVKSLKSEDADAEVPPKVMNTDIDAMNTLMVSSIAIEPIAPLYMGWSQVASISKN